MGQSGIWSEAREVATQLRGLLDGRAEPRTAIIAGSGLDALAQRVEDAVSVSTADLPYWPRSTVEGHAGQVVMGTIAAMPVAVLRGRVHFYEGYEIQQVAFPVWVLRALGVERLVVTNAAGGLNLDWSAGEIMLIRDHINLPGMAGHNPLIGPHEPQLGPRFSSLTNAYCPRLRTIARHVAERAGVTLREGVYAMVSGPTFETPAELRFLRVVGADAVGMSTAPEVVVARHGGMEVLGLSLLTNIALFDPQPDEETTHAEVLEVGAEAAPHLARLVEGVLETLVQEEAQEA